MKILTKEFATRLAKELFWFLLSELTADMTDNDWEEIFARCIGADWTPSNVGLDDVVLEQTAWGAKTVKNRNPFNVKHVRLIFGRNSPDYSFKIENVHGMPESEVGERVLSIWNERLSDIRKRFKHVRTVVLLKGDQLGKVAVYEEETVRFLPEDYYWEWNENRNLVGYERATDKHRFTWQPHGSQFTVISEVPERRMKLIIRRPALVDKDFVLDQVGFDPSWVEIVP